MPPLAVVSFYFGSPKSTLYTMAVASEWFNIVSNFGAQLGLCVGFSLLSLVEIVYFYTWRFWRHIYKSFSGDRDSIQFLQRQDNKVYPSDRKTGDGRPPKYVEMNRQPFFNKETKLFFLK